MLKLKVILKQIEDIVILPCVMYIVEQIRAQLCHHITKSGLNLAIGTADKAFFFRVVAALLARISHWCQSWT